MSKKIFFLLTVIIFLGWGIFNPPAKLNFSDEPQKVFAEPDASESPAPAPTENIFAGVQESIYSTLNDGSDYAVYLAYPQKSPEPFLYNSKKMRSASMIKVFILAATMELVKDGNLSLDQPLTLHSYEKVGGAGILAGYASGTQLSLREVLKLMITHSDNTATNMVINLLGMSTVNEYLQMNGYTDTILQRKMMDFGSGRENYTSAKDLGTIFQKIYNHQCVSSAHDEVMINFLLGQT